MADDNLNNPAPEPWRPDPRWCCIYKIPRDMRQRKPEAYTPQRVLIGPLNYEEIVKARENPGNIGNANAAEYLKKQEHKLIYRAAFEARVGNNDSIRQFKDYIVEEEWRIRASYSESTELIPQQEFMAMIYYDSLFIIEFLIRTSPLEKPMPDDPLTMPGHQTAILKDLMLLENQLPFFILESLFDLTRPQLRWGGETFRVFLIYYFRGGRNQLEGEIKHFTDLLRRLYVDTLEPGPHPGEDFFRDTLDPEHPCENLVRPIYNADKLKRGGVKLVAGREEPSLVVSFVNGILEIPRFTIDEITVVKLRNMMALELCHYSDQPFVCNYVMFLDNLIDTERDVDALVEKGILRRSGDSAAIARIVNNLGPGDIKYFPYLRYIAMLVNDYYDEREKKYNGLLPTLKRTYFPNLWSGTATVVASFIVISTVGSFIVALIEAGK